MKLTEFYSLAICIMLGLAAGLFLGKAVDPLPPKSELLAAGEEGAQSRSEKAEALLARLDEKSEEIKSARSRQAASEDSEKHKRARGEPAGEDYVAAREAERDTKKALAEYSNINRELSAVFAEGEEYHAESDDYQNLKSEPTRRKHFILYAA